MKYLKTISLFVLILFPGLALANAGEAAAAGGILALVFGIAFSFWALWMMIVGTLMLVNIMGIALWIWMIIDVAKRDFKEENDKMMWILIVVLTGWIGSLIYYFMIKRKEDDKKIN